HAISAYKLALEVRTRETFSQDWATTQGNLGAAYSNRIRGDRAENLEQAITIYQRTLQVHTREAFPQDWATTQGNLGAAYSDRIRGDRAENLEQAISAYQLALQIHTRQTFPEDWARLQHNLGNAYRERIHGGRDQNLKLAIDYYNHSAQIFTRAAYPYKWANNQGHLAEAFIQIASIQATTNEKLYHLNKAIDLLQAALTVSVLGSPDFIDSQYRLGNALSRRYEHSQNSKDLEQALKAYKIALDAISPEHYNRQKIWQALPATQTILGHRLVREGQWQEGLQLLLNSVHQLNNSDDQLAHANALFQTGRAHETLADLHNARVYYRDALRLYTHLDYLPGIANSQAELGQALLLQGHASSGLGMLAKARDSYQQLNKPDKVAEMERVCADMKQTLSEQNLLTLEVLA
ncbi:MAG: tetratricopeptide repeat protein, partial [Cyanobacteria bacterium J06628_6]